MSMCGRIGRVLPVVALLAAGCAKEEVVHQLTEFEANEIVYVLEAGGVKAHKEREEGGRTITYKVTVGGADAQDARRVLVDNQLPRPREMTLDRVYDPANKGLIPTATEEEAGFIMAIQGEIARKIKTIPGVVEAHVTIVKPKKDLLKDLNEKPTPATAAVTITFNQVGGKAPFKVEDIQRLVAASVEGLDPQYVTVMANLNRPATEKMLGTFGTEDEAGGQDLARAPKFGGIAVVNEQERKKLQTILMGGGAALGVALIGLIALLVSFVTTSSKLKQANTQLTALAKRNAPAPPPPPG
ncbi:MAG: hypothetical protein HY904_18625 [Deltaproteobacteria bacterium]|nr:hypothetical protein [Deltaproteobacteria bacterium]